MAPKIERKPKVKQAKKKAAKSVASDPERFLYAKLRRKHAKEYVDPFQAGPAAMARYVDAMMEFMRTSYPDSGASGIPTLNGLLAKQLLVTVSDGPEVSVRYEYLHARAIISIPRIPDESAEEEERRRIRVAQNALPVLPKGIFEVLAEMIRGMPKEGLKKLLTHYSSTKRKSRPA